MKKKSAFFLSTTQIILISFLIVIFIGSLLLSLPISSATGERVSYIDALFTATTATCVTGLVTLTTATAWSLFGQVVILILIQIGGLGLITIIAGIMVAMHRKFGLKDGQLIRDAFNLNSLSGLARFVKRVLIGTFAIELCGALLYMTVFIPEFGVRGIWMSLFTSISAFCNAGIDIIGDNSLCNYAQNPLVNLFTSLLIILGGLGFVVWWDVLRVLGDYKKMGRRCFSKLTLHTKIVLVSTAILLVGGGVLIFIFEYNNPQTIASYSLFDKLQVSFFQSVTTRTAGFASIPQGDLTNASSILSLVLMFIGGSPIGTAGGIKTVTVVALYATAYATIRNKNEVSVFGRSLSADVTRRAVAVSCMSFAIMLISTLALAAVCDAGALDILYETVSATGTVGLSRDLTPTLDVFGKIIIITTMYLGRIGPISLAIAVRPNGENTNSIKNPTEEISIG